MSKLFCANTASPYFAACALPMFTLPVLPIRIHSFKLPLFVRNRRDEPLVSLAIKVPLASCPILQLEAAPLTCVCAVVPLFTSSVFPFTCRAAVGLIVPIATLVPLSKMLELPNVPALSSHLGTTFALPLPLTASGVGLEAVFAVVGPVEVAAVVLVVAEEPELPVA